MSHQSTALTALHSAACRQYYDNSTIAEAWLATYDASRGIYRPGPRNQLLEQQLHHATGRRFATYEDQRRVAEFAPPKRPRHWTPDNEPFELPLWVRTAQRAVKVFFVPPTAKAPFLAPAVWKCASTTLNKMLAESTPYCRDAVHSGGYTLPSGHPCIRSRDVLRVRPERAWPDAVESGSCAQTPTKHTQAKRRGCARYGSFSIDAARRRHVLQFAFVRDPVDRFIAAALMTLRESGLNNCTRNWFWTDPCPHALPMMRELAIRLYKHFPHGPAYLPPAGTSEHWLTQSYFLSSTDFGA